MQKTYLFYDLETTGINKCFDQIIQFAAVRTDETLNVISQHSFFVKLNSDTIPTPDAVITHQISIEQANKGLSEYEAIQKIHTLFNEPNTISVGYNSLTFDDEFLRFSFFKNLLSPYEHQYKNGCLRMDIYPMAAAYYLFEQSVLNWPTDDNSKVSLKLENINKQNGLYVEGRAHDAITDVFVTVALARKFKNSQPKIWDYFVAHFNKTEDQRTLSKLDVGLTIDNETYQQALMVSGRFGATEQFMWPVLNLGQHRHYKNQWCFLRLDYVDLQEVTTDTIQDHFLTVTKKWGDLPFLLPAKKRFLAHFSQERIQKIKENKQFLNNNPELFIMIKEAALDFTYPEVENVDVDASLYQSGFMNDAEQNLCQHFHQSNIEGKVKLMSKMEGSYYQRALRIIGRISPEQLAPDVQLDYQEYLERIASYEIENMPVDYKGEHKTSIPEVLERIEQLRLAPLTEEQLALLEELENYLAY